MADDKSRNQWGIILPNGDWIGWEPDLVRRGRPSAPQLPDRDETVKTLLYGADGKPIMVRGPRPLGFRPERAG